MWRFPLFNSSAFVIAILTLTAMATVSGNTNAKESFPQNFQWGLATSAYQVEGAWNVSGKGESVWDFWTHENGGKNIKNGANADITSDSYHNYQKDTTLLAQMKASFYKLSLSWPRIVPTGKIIDGINQAGIDHYNKVINALVAQGIQPFVTLHQWDLPIPLVRDGSWTNDSIVEHFEDYARIAFSNFGDRVKLWVPLHEPLILVQAKATYGSHAAFPEPPVTQYRAAHNVLKAHAAAYHVYKHELKLTGQVGLTLNSEWPEPKDPMNFDHIKAAERLLAFQLGWFMDPVTHGDYPQAMRDNVPSSRLPEFDAEYKRKLIGSMDFLAYNYFFAANVFPTDGTNGGLKGDGKFGTEFHPDWKLTGGGLPIAPWGLRKILNWIKTKYGPSLPIYLISGCGETAELDTVNDEFRVDFFRAHLKELLTAVREDEANVVGFTAWSLIDNFEWESGFTVKYGVHSVDFEDPARPRTPKKSARFLSNVFHSNIIPSD